MRLEDLPPGQQNQIQALRERLSEVQQAIVAGGDPVALALHQIYAPLILQSAVKIEILEFEVSVLQTALTASGGPVEMSDSPSKE